MPTRFFKIDIIIITVKGLILHHSQCLYADHCTQCMPLTCVIRLKAVTESEAAVDVSLVDPVGSRIY